MQRQVDYNHLISNKCEWNNCFIKNNQEILLDLADFDFKKNQIRIFNGRCFSDMVQWLVYHGREANQIPGIALYNDPAFNSEMRRQVQ